MLFVSQSSQYLYVKGFCSLSFGVLAGFVCPPSVVIAKWTLMLYQAKTLHCNVSLSACAYYRVSIVG